MFDESYILSQKEALQLVKMTDASEVKLLYRATVDGFSSRAFHSKCDGKGKTITIIRNDLDYVFGGYTSAKWMSDDKAIEDSSAFIFGLRMFGNTVNHKMLIKSDGKKKAIGGFQNQGATFGCCRKNADILVCDQSNRYECSYTNVCKQYECPYSASCLNKTCKNSNFLSGTHSWKSKEIEVYQIVKFQFTYF